MVFRRGGMTGVLAGVQAGRFGGALDDHASDVLVQARRFASVTNTKPKVLPATTEVGVVLTSDQIAYLDQ